MAYLIFIANEAEIDRRELTNEPVTIGRAPDCDVSIHDIVLSRHHCRIEPDEGGGWTVIDLSSKNGTLLRGNPIGHRRVLRDGDDLRIGRARVMYFAGPFVAVPGGAPR